MVSDGATAAAATKRTCDVLCLPHQSLPEVARFVHRSPGWLFARMLAQSGFIPTVIVVISIQKWGDRLSAGGKFWGLGHKVYAVQVTLPR
jgi:hypothetical protein